MMEDRRARSQNHVLLDMRKVALKVELLAHGEASAAGLPRQKHCSFLNDYPMLAHQDVDARHAVLVAICALLGGMCPAEVSPPVPDEGQMPVGTTSMLANVVVMGVGRGAHSTDPHGMRSAQHEEPQVRPRGEMFRVALATRPESSNTAKR